MAPQPIAIGGSSNIAAVAWDPDTRELTVDFQSGDSYIYAGVPESVANGFTAASSPGQYHARHIKDRYPYERV